MGSRVLKTYVVAVVLVALAVLARLDPAYLGQRPWTGLLLVVLTGVAALRPVRIPSLRTDFVPTHPFILLALASLGPLAAALASVGGVVAAALGRDRPPAVVRFVFNLGAVVLSTAAASWAFNTLGGVPGQTPADLLLPLAGAAAIHFFANTGLIAAPIAFENRQGLLGTWRRCFLWSALADLTGLTLAVALLAMLEGGLAWLLLLGLPPSWVLVSFYRSHAAGLLGETSAGPPIQYR